MDKHSLKDWLVAVRPWSFPAFFMLVAVTLAYLYWMQQDVNWTNGVWALLNIIVFHAAGNTWSDYFDYKHHVDREDTHGVRVRRLPCFCKQAKRHCYLLAFPGER